MVDKKRATWEANAAANAAALSDGCLRLVVLGEPASKGNSRRLVPNPRTGRTMSIKSEKAIEYVKSLGHQVPKINPLLTGDLVFHCVIYYASRRPDLDESLIMDGLQKRIYQNDRQLKEKHVFWRLDRINPRAEITLWPSSQPELALNWPLATYAVMLPRKATQ